jgi:hypothetical protein
MHLQDYMVSQHQRPPPEHPLLWEPWILVLFVISRDTRPQFC